MNQPRKPGWNLRTNSSAFIMSWFFGIWKLGFLSVERRETSGCFAQKNICFKNFWPGIFQHDQVVQLVNRMIPRPNLPGEKLGSQPMTVDDCHGWFEKTGFWKVVGAAKSVVVFPRMKKFKVHLFWGTIYFPMFLYGFVKRGTTWCWSMHIRCRMNVLKCFHFIRQNRSFLLVVWVANLGATFTSIFASDASPTDLVQVISTWNLTQLKKSKRTSDKLTNTIETYIESCL